MVKKIIAIGALTFLPFIAAAQIKVAGDAQSTVNEALGYILPIIFTIALAFFFWNLARFFWGSKEDQGAAKTGLGWSFAILIIMVSLGGIVAVLQDSVEFKDQQIDVNNFKVDIKKN